MDTDPTIWVFGVPPCPLGLDVKLAFPSIKEKQSRANHEEME